MMQLSTAGYKVGHAMFPQWPRGGVSTDLRTDYDLSKGWSFLKDLRRHAVKSHRKAGLASGGFPQAKLLRNKEGEEYLVAWLEVKGVDLKVEKMAELSHYEQASSIIDFSKKVTGLSIKDLAAVFQVSRQTLYNYRKSQERIADKNWERIKAVEQQVEYLSGIFISSPGSLSKRFSVDGYTLYGLLIEDVLDGRRIEEVARKLAQQMEKSSSAGHQYSETLDQLTRHA